MKRFPAATAALRRRLGARVVRTDEAELAEAGLDGSKLSVRPEARLRLRREADVGVVPAFAQPYSFPYIQLPMPTLLSRISSLAAPV